jgi:hypothetical protein
MLDYGRGRNRLPARPPGIIRREVSEVSGGCISKGNALILTSRETGKMNAADVNRHIRSHWGIENRSHYIRDTVYREDRPVRPSRAASSRHMRAPTLTLAPNMCTPTTTTRSTPRWSVCAILDAGSSARTIPRALNQPLHRNHGTLRVTGRTTCLPNTGPTVRGTPIARRRSCRCRSGSTGAILFSGRAGSVRGLRREPDRSRCLG